MKRFLPFIFIAVVAVAAATSGALLYRAKRSELSRVASSIMTETNSVDATGTNSLHVRGETKAIVTLEEFGDFQCPPCSVLAASLAHIEHDYGTKLRVIFREFPLAMHPHAQEAAAAAEAAGLQGRFWEMHDLLYRNQVAWSSTLKVDETFQQYARTLGLEIDRFERDRASEEIADRIAADHKLGESRGVSSTPSIFINGRNLPPLSGTEAGLRGAIDAAISGEPLPESTPTPTK